VVVTVAVAVCWLGNTAATKNKLTASPNQPELIPSINHSIHSTPTSSPNNHLYDTLPTPRSRRTPPAHSPPEECLRRQLDSIPSIARFSSDNTIHNTVSLPCALYTIYPPPILRVRQLCYILFKCFSGPFPIGTSDNCRNTSSTSHSHSFACLLVGWGVSGNCGITFQLGTTLQNSAASCCTPPSPSL